MVRRKRLEEEAEELGEVGEGWMSPRVSASER